jgi:hypothetical protein
MMIRYNFRFEDGKQKTFRMKLNDRTLNLERPASGFPEWTKLTNFKCPHCKLGENAVYCPLAVNLSDVINFFKEVVSYDKVDLIVETDVRQYRKYTSVQSGLSSLLGILMVANECPVMGKLKPMLRFHLPFATIDETEYRILSMYLLAQYFRWKKGQEPDWEMTNLVSMYDEIKILNQYVVKKINELEVRDASLNAVVTLNNFAEHITFILNRHILDKFESLFKDYL